MAINKAQRAGIAYACAGMKLDERSYLKSPSRTFLRKAYAGTSAETKDNTQEELHKYDYLRGDRW